MSAAANNPKDLWVKPGRRPVPNKRQRIRAVAGRLDASSSVVAATVLNEVGEWTQAEVCEAAGCCAPSLRKCRAKITH